MPLNDLTANHIGGTGANAGYEPQRANNNILQILGLEGDAKSILQLSLASFPIPKVNVGVIEVNYLNEKRKFAGIASFDDLSVVFTDYVDKDTAKILHQWFAKTYDADTGKVGLAKDYKKDGKVIQYSPDGQLEREYDVQGMWISALDPGDADMSSEDILRVTCTITIDKAVPTFATQ
jgi:hypothetical protein